MGYEFWILKPKDKTRFNLGKGYYHKPLEDFGEFNGKEIMDNAKTNEEHMIAHKTDFNRKMIADNLQDFIELYKSAADKGVHEEDGGAYVGEVAESLWNWLGDDDVWIYSDDIFDYFPREEWTETGTRYTKD